MICPCVAWIVGKYREWPFTGTSDEVLISSASLLWWFLAFSTKETSGRRKGIMGLLAGFIPLRRQGTGCNMALAPGNPACRVGTRSGWRRSLMESWDFKGFLPTLLFPFILHSIRFIGCGSRALDNSRIPCCVVPLGCPVRGWSLSFSLFRTHRERMGPFHLLHEMEEQCCER